MTTIESAVEDQVLDDDDDDDDVKFESFFGGGYDSTRLGGLSGRAA